jgi:hypothetical protein
MSEPSPSDGHDKEAHPPIKASVNVLVGLCSVLIVSSILLQFRQQLSYGSAHVLRRSLSRLTLQDDQRNEVSSCHPFPCICHLHFWLAKHSPCMHASRTYIVYIIYIAMNDAGCSCVCVRVRPGLALNWKRPGLPAATCELPAIGVTLSREQLSAGPTGTYQHRTNDL